MDIDHVYETLKVGIDTLAAGTGSIPERLWETWTVIHTLNEDECRGVIAGEEMKLDSRSVFRVKNLSISGTWR
jgi:hypothetical protein